VLPEDAESRVTAPQLVVPLQPSRRRLAGIALSTRTSRWTSLTWALAWGGDALPDSARVRFSSGTLRFRSSVDSAVHWLDGSCWVAEAAGDYALATVVVQDVDVSTVALSDRIMRGH
jgi:hypothetical protein